ncbi:MAG: AmmeMemoRadiSam system radical SAM enzyme [Dehalococcoidales bacterium]|nr:MAG: AmmeMemoRadiSam system radical SAM enzyme [Dehalococcoidales bacterium]
MHEALLSEKRPSSYVRCGTCQWRCTIASGRSGFCRMYQNRDGQLYNLNYAQVSSMAPDPIEKKPLFHFYPGSLCFSLGGWGCNFHCEGCQNWQISAVRDSERLHGSREVLPEAAVELAQNYDCQGISWTYNEPSIWFEYTLDSARLAKEKGLYTVYVTNGYLTPEALDTIGPYLDAWRVDVKGFSDSLYRKLAKITHWQGILEVAERAKNKWNMHVEVITNVIPTLNDDDEQLRGIASWIHDRLGELTPWHITRFHPQYQMMDLPATPLDTLEHACDIGRAAGLKFIYLGNVPGHKAENTVCYSCGNLNVARSGYDARIVGLVGSTCRFCGEELNFRVTDRGGGYDD